MAVPVSQVVTMVLDGQEVNKTWEELSHMILQSSATYRGFSTAWLVVRAVQIFLVKIGMLFFEIGSVSAKNTKVMIIQNICCSSISAICFYLLGYGFGFGDQGDDFIGWSGFATKGDLFEADGLYSGGSFAHFFYYFCVLNLVPSIVAGSLSERTSPVAYFVLTFFISFLITPVLMHWAWSSEGWASYHTRSLMNTGVLDFAGSSVIHLSGGIMALVGTMAVGPRLGRFNRETSDIRMPLQNVTFSALGVFFVWAGYYAFNMGTIENFTGNGVNALGKIAVNTTISAAVSAVTVSVICYIKERCIDPYSVCNGIWAGLVGSSAGCATMTTEGALVTGLLCGAAYFLISWMLCSYKIDDVTDTCPVHVGGGVVGMVTAGFFTTQSLYKIAILDSGVNTPCGAFYVCNGLGWRQLIANIIFVLAVSGWSLLAGVALFVPLRIMGLLRVCKTTEDAGIDFFSGTNLIDLSKKNVRIK